MMKEPSINKRMLSLGVMMLFLCPFLNAQNSPLPRNPMDPFQGATNSPLFPVNLTEMVRQRDRAMEEKNKLRFEQDVREYHELRAREEALEKGHPPILYDFMGPVIPGRKAFIKAYVEMGHMLKNRAPLSLKRAVFLSEHAYDTTITWDDFSRSVDDMVKHITLMMEQHRIPNENLAKNMALMRFFSDTISLNYPNKEAPVTSYPFFYDFDDFWGREDPAKLMVSKLMRDGTGQCRSLPLLYLILAEELDTEAYLALAPNHSYIKFQDEIGNWYNLELTNHMITSDQFIQYSGYTTAASLRSGIYMQPLSKEETIAQCINDLVSFYAKKYGYEAILKPMISFAYSHNQRSVTSHHLMNNWYLANLRFIEDQYRYYGLSKEQFYADEQVTARMTQLEGLNDYLQRLGFANMPAAQYEAWLNSLQEEAQKQDHRNKMRTLMGQVDN